jgi:hypothetical protein
LSPCTTCPALQLIGRHHVHGEAVLVALRLQKLRRAAAILAEVEVEADHRPGDGEALHQDVGDEPFGGEVGQRRVEGEQDRAVEAGRREQPQLRGLGTQQERRRIRLKECARMRLEGQDRGGPVRGMGALHGGRDHGAMAAVHAVKVADSNHRAAQPIQSRPRIADDDEGLHRESSIRQ